MLGKRLRSTLFKGGVGKGVDVPAVGCNNFRIIPPNCMVGLTSILDGNSHNMDFWQATKSKAQSTTL